MRFQAMLFDAYGTLFDVNSAILRSAQGLDVDPAALSALWRQKQLEYTWQRSLMGRYRDFDEITEEALTTALEQLNSAASPEQVSRLLEAYRRLDAFPEVRQALEALKNIPKAILSNGTLSTIEGLVRHNALDSLIPAVLSADEVGIYKPSGKVYELGTTFFGLPARDILFLSSNIWDASGAKAFGYSVCWVNRTGTRFGSRAEFPPDRIISSLVELA